MYKVLQRTTLVWITFIGSSKYPLRIRGVVCRTKKGSPDPEKGSLAQFRTSLQKLDGHPLLNTKSAQSTVLA